MNLAAAGQLASLLNAAAESAGLDVITTLDPEAAQGLIDAGHDVLILNPPKILWPTFNDAEATWTILAITGRGDRITAWDQLDAIVELVRRTLGADEADPYDWRTTTHDTIYPAYRLTITTDYTL